MNHTEALSERRRFPTRKSGFVFRGKVLLLRAQRLIQDVRSGVRPSPWQSPQSELSHFVEHRSPLWTSNQSSEQGLQIGKAQNLRIAVRRLNGLMLESGQLFSFWGQVGRASRRRGYVAGRELREGCIMPGVGGGLCQLSNALYDLALRAGFAIVERHPHSQVVPGSAAERDRDATVAWNYIDLRFRPSQRIQLEAFLTETELVLRFRARQPLEAERAVAAARTNLRVLNATPGSCETCGETGCFQHESLASVQARDSVHRRGVLVDGIVPEIADCVDTWLRSGDFLLQPLDGRRWRVDRYAWRAPAGVNVLTAWPVAIHRMVEARKEAAPPVIRSRQLGGADALARAYHRMLPPDATELIVDISLLKELYVLGALGGRRVTVWMSRLPLKLIHQQLDLASLAYPECNQLSDFRANERDVELEWQALDAVSRIESAHPFLVESLRNVLPGEIDLVDWKLPAVGEKASMDRGYIFFPGPTAAREGVIAVREMAKSLGLPVVVAGRNLESADFWDGVRVFSAAGHPMSGAKVVVHPAIFKNRANGCLFARQMGKPVIATPACGVPGAIEVPFGDAEALIREVKAFL